MPTFWNDLEMDQNEVKNAVLHKVTNATLPTSPKVGQVVYNATYKDIQWWEGTFWKSFDDSTVQVVTGDLSGLEGGDGTNSISLKVRIDNNTIGIDSQNNQLYLKDNSITSGKLRNNAVSTSKIRNGNVTLPKIQPISSLSVLGNISGSINSVEEVNISNDPTLSDGSSLNTTQSIKEYIDQNAATAGQFVGGLDASSGTFPTIGSNGSSVSKGDFWRVTNGGTIGAFNLSEGDLFYAESDTPTNTDWFSITDTTSSTATESSKGILEIADNTEILDTSNNSRIVTPRRLWEVLQSYTPSTYSETIGNNSATTFTINHNIGSEDVNIDLYESGQRVYASTSIVDSNSVQLSFYNAPTFNSIKVVITKG